MTGDQTSLLWDVQRGVLQEDRDLEVQEEKTGDCTMTECSRIMSNNISTELRSRFIYY